jgi:hypothetical protein
MNAFAGDPQPVEIHHRGIWYSGELLGWRHEGEGQVVARVRCVVDGLRHSTWKDLGELRLPDPRRPPRKERFPANPGLGRSTEAPEDDATRPHVLLAGMGRRTKPAHAVTPPPRSDRPSPAVAPAPGPEDRELPAVLARWDRLLTERRTLRTAEREPAEVSAG